MNDDILRYEIRSAFPMPNDSGMEQRLLASIPERAPRRRPMWTVAAPIFATAVIAVVIGSFWTVNRQPPQSPKSPLSIVQTGALSSAKASPVSDPKNGTTPATPAQSPVGSQQGQSPAPQPPQTTPTGQPAVAACTTSDIRTTVTTNEPTYAPGAVVEIMVAIVNTSTQPCSIPANSTSISVSSSTGHVAWQCSVARLCFNNALILQPQDSRAWSVPWGQTRNTCATGSCSNVLPGTYTVSGQWIGSGSTSIVISDRQSHLMKTHKNVTPLTTNG